MRVYERCTNRIGKVDMYLKRKEDKNIKMKKIGVQRKKGKTKKTKGKQKKTE